MFKYKPFIHSQVIIATLSCCSLFADCTTCDLPGETSPTLEQISEKNVFGKYQGKTTSDSIDSGILVTGGFIYWIAREGGLDYAERFTLGINLEGALPSVIESSLSPKGVDFTWKPGAKASIGYIFSQREQWDVAASWTYLHSKASGSATSPIPVTLSPQINFDGLKPLWSPLFMGAVADSASGAWSLTFNSLDGDLGRRYFIGRFISLRPSIGLRAAWISQDYKTKYHSGFQVIGPGGISSYPINTKMDAENNFSGVGLKLGADLSWYMSKEWSILGNFSGSLLAGKFTIKQDYLGGFLLDTSLGVTPLALTYERSFHRLRPELDGQLGVKWQKFLSDNKYRISVSLSYTMAYWFFQNELVNQIATTNTSTLDGTSTHNDGPISPTTENGNLEMQGGTLEMRFDF